MTAFELLVAGLACFAFGFIAALAYVIWDLRQDRLDREAWTRMPGALPVDEPLYPPFDWADDQLAERA